MGAADWVIRNFDDQIAGYDKSLGQMRNTLDHLPEHERTAVEEAARELRKARSVAAFVSLESLKIRSGV
ncbi:hypothetical protein [Streptomyces aureocirculatus]|uniref:hypothetical protein n=1 Tax=Streptomyces aureocirculatus TaxID=67275 RepID=UPI0004C71CE9|nr:hypothetical protein [Streptomyces aureocirculatus]